ncbi:hypothetical protein H2201_008505 [Coniosporium apollinis]|uniref:Glucose 1-dehydrogenase n=2 Tax=Coniosporium TaxID=2810619 RepID=A0ABQ9NK95_9PEZI|nr:hypothetical protein H2199_007404 [Cladosporium sp. JES 115]KAJ9656572.1 hypothetical protein H2201_008505 [Coniosporium apollinis]
MPGRLQDKVAIVTGSSSGLGRAIALAYAAEGAKVICADLAPTARKDIVIEQEQGTPTHEEVIELGGNAVFVQTDVGNSEDVENVVKAAIYEYGRLDIMVNNAEIAAGGADGLKLIHELLNEGWDKMMRINSTGVFYGCRAAIKQTMKQDLHPIGSRGWIINTASVAGLVGFIGAGAAYSASKGSVVQLTKSIALEYAQHKIHSNCLCPGVVNTALTKQLTEHPEMHDRIVGMHPWGRLGEPQDVARAAVFLASEDAGWITGVPLPVDGGYLAQ